MPIPASDLPTVLVALGARIVAIGPRGERTIAADDFFTGIMTTALARGRNRHRDRGPAAATGPGLGVREVLASGLALRGGRRGGARHGGGGTCTRGAVSRSAACCRTPVARRAVEQALTGQPLDAAAIAAAAAASGRATLATTSTGDHLRLGRVSQGRGAGLRQARDRRRRRARVARRRNAVRLAAATQACPVAVRVPRSTSCSRRWPASATSPSAGWRSRSTSRCDCSGRCSSKARRASARPKSRRCSPRALDTELIRLQCYEGLDVSHAVYEWNYPRQLLEIRLLEAAQRARPHRGHAASCSPSRS